MQLRSFGVGVPVAFALACFSPDDDAATGTDGSSTADGGSSDSGSGSGSGSAESETTGTSTTTSASTTTATTTGPSTSASSDSSSSGEGSSTGPAEPCNLLEPFGEIELVPGIDSTVSTLGAWLTDDELAIYYAAESVDSFDLFLATRESVDDPFADPTVLDNVSGTPDQDGYPTLTGDVLVMYFGTARSDGIGNADIYVASRDIATSAFGTAALVGGINTAGSDDHPFVTADGLTLYFSSDDLAPGFPDLYRSTVGGGGEFGPREVVPGLDSEAGEGNPVLTPDELTIFFRRAADIFVSSRNAIEDDFEDAILVEELSGDGDDIPLWITPDACTLYLTSNGLDRSGVYQLASASRPAD